MRKTIIPIILGIFLVGMISAIYGGECEVVEFPNEDNVTFQIISNDTDMSEFSWSKNGTIITYCFSINAEPGEFNVRWKNGAAEVEVESESGGSCLTNWVCSDWSSCDGEYKSRTCEKRYSHCIQNTEKPLEKESCGSGNESIQDASESEETKNKKLLYIILGVIILLILGIIWYNWWK